MIKRVLLCGLLGGFVLFAWAVISNGIFGLRTRIEMKRIPAERQVYEVLKGSITDPGRYVCNPQITSSEVFPGGEPVFSIQYSGFGHEAAGRVFVVQLLIAVVAPMIAAGMLSVASARILSRYSWKVLFFATLGLLIAVFSDLMKFDIGAYPLNHALLLAANDIISWVLVGLAVAWLIKPEPGPGSERLPSSGP
jgi:hypothetical protein